MNKTMRKRTLTTFAAIIALALTAAACGDKKDDAKTSAPAPPTSQSAGSGAEVVVNKGTSDLGDILVGKDGMTLYGFTQDIDGVSTCSGTCADAWPPVLVGANWSVGPGLDSGVFSTVKRDDGSEQLVAGKWPLYYYSGDTTAGDTKGQGSGDVWFVVGTDAKLIKKAATGGGNGGQTAAQSVKLADSPLGKILVDGEGKTLYGFTKDANGTPTCKGDCATTWPAELVEGNPVVGDGLDSSVFTLVDGANGGKQLKAGKWPLYNFAGDSGPGDVNGQGSGGVWFVVGADGKLIKNPPAAQSSQSDSDY